MTKSVLLNILKKKEFCKATTLILLIYGFFSCSKSVAPPEPIYPLPSEKQLAWHELEMYAFIHFTTNTFTDLEWGYGDEDPNVFNPGPEFDPNQWAKVIKDAGLKGIVFTCKHHDGFALWPSKYTEHSVKNSRWMNGKGDVVRAVSDACKKYGLKFGVYLSPWDRNRADYGSPSYVEYYRNQLKEVFTLYEPVFEMWFDGANGGDGYYGGAKEKREINTGYYNWPETIDLVEELEPEIILFSDFGPDVRWCGNEEGYAGDPNWSMINKDSIEKKLITGKEKKAYLNKGRPYGTSFIPAEVDVSIRPGWFYHANEDTQVKSPEELFDIYLTSVGRGSNLILNIPPDRRGLIHENDVASLLKWKELINERFASNLVGQGKISVSSYRGGKDTYSAQKMVDENKDTYWATDDGVQKGIIEIEFPEDKKISYLLIQEYIRLGQRVKQFNVEAWEEDKWVEVGNGATIGYKRIVRLNSPKLTKKIRINILDSKTCPLISNIEIY
ncbi:alpha-L-fucosidase [Confluentibacter sediminis]|uniref:alpha-L-fucosidase n=1 Tax=Confluentibacter sediminis TaxID=2219045 RepID=UPI000DAE0572|nr:alpha-L-fucosidase [Confluentibacter sediminis]